MESELLTALAQHGLAGLMGCLWLLERRHSGLRERQLTESHTLILRKHEELAELLEVVKENSVAMTALERSQARLSQVCENILFVLQARPTD